jgi:hypothetical protein
MGFALTFVLVAIIRVYLIRASKLYVHVARLVVERIENLRVGAERGPVDSAPGHHFS